MHLLGHRFLHLILCKSSLGLFLGTHRWFRMPEKAAALKICSYYIEIHKTSGKTKKQMGGCGPEECITTARDKRMEEKS